jgi:hypothetical protein
MHKRDIPICPKDAVVSESCGDIIKDATIDGFRCRWRYFGKTKKLKRFLEYNDDPDQPLVPWRRTWHDPKYP